MRLAVCFFAILAIMIACKKDKINVNSYWDCNLAQNLDSTAVSGKLIGTWTWAKQQSSGGNVSENANRNIKVTFKTDHSFLVQENATTLTQGSWKIVPGDAKNWSLDLSLPSEFLNGVILLCGNEVLFSSSYLDGYDYLFKRQN